MFAFDIGGDSLACLVKQRLMPGFDGKWSVDDIVP